ncbi:hypothetical protein MBANPS3_012144 [Mucor bainieri]
MNERLDDIERMMESQDIVEYFHAYRTAQNANQMQENSLLEEAIYCRTRKRTLTSTLGQQCTYQEASSSSTSSYQEANSSSSSNTAASSHSNVSSSNSNDEADILNEISYVSATTDDTEYSYQSSDGECVTYTKRYICCFDESMKVKGSKISIQDVKEYDANLACFEDILEISSIKYNEESAIMADARLGESLTSLLAHVRKKLNSPQLRPASSTSYRTCTSSHTLIFMQWTLYAPQYRLSDTWPSPFEEPRRRIQDKTHVSLALYSVSRIQYSMVSFFAITSKPITNLSHVIGSDVASEAYKNTNTKSFEIIRPNFVVLHESVELITVEVKPFNTATSLIDEDEARVAELSKKTMHRRMTIAKTVKKFCSFGICIVGK